MTRTVAPLAILLAAASARAVEPSFTIPLSATLGFAEQPAESPDPAVPAPAAFGESGSDWLSVGGGVAISDDSNDFNAYATYHIFLAKNFEFDVTLGGWYFSQDKDDAAGINPAIGFRWHFLNKQSWSLYADFGIGLLASNDDVPYDGTSFNFTPRAGIGSTIALGNAATAPRLDLGVRWHHISNASLNGTDDNPARDGVMFYAGVMFNF